MLKYVAATVCAVLALCASAHGQTYSPFQFLRVNQSARAAALGGSFVQMSEDPSALFFNPASITTVANGRTSLTFQKHLLDINSGLASYIGKAGTGSWAAAVSYASFGTFNETNAAGVKTGRTISAANVSIGGVYSNSIDTNFHYGVGLNYVQATLADASASAITLNAGLLYQIPKARTNIGLSILHLGAQLSKINVSEPLPVDVRLGVNHRLRGLPLMVNLSFNRLAEDQQSVLERFKNFSIGGELYLGKVLEVRLGYDNTVRNATAFDTQARLAGLSLGAGAKIKEITIDYAMSSLSSAGSLHRFSVGVGL